MRMRMVKKITMRIMHGICKLVISRGKFYHLFRTDELVNCFHRITEQFNLVRHRLGIYLADTL